MERIAARLNIPLCRPVNVTVPYLLPLQKSKMETLINCMVRSTNRSSWERKAIRAHVRVVPSAPLNVRRAFERLSNKHEKSDARPPCKCNKEHLHLWSAAGPVRLVDGHFALLPVTIMHQGSPLRATDPLPCHGTRSRAHAISCPTKLAQTLHIQHHFPTSIISEALPANEWNSDAPLRHRVQNIARNLNSIATVRIADKSSTMLFAFCRQWLWDQTIQFLTDEEYTSRPTSDNGQIQTALHTIMRKNKWPVNTDRTLPLLYLPGKAKSLTKQCILWRPIAAIVEPQVQRFYLRTAARAFTLLLRLLVSEILGVFLVLKISDLQP